MMIWDTTHVVPAEFDEFFDAVDDEEGPFAIVVADVAGVEPGVVGDRIHADVA